MNFATTFQDRIYNRLAAGQTSSARSDCGHIAAEADTEIELLKEELLDVTAQRDMKQPALDQAIAQMKKQSIEIARLRTEVAGLGVLLCELLECDALGVGTNTMPPALLSRWQNACDEHIALTPNV